MYVLSKLIALPAALISQTPEARCRCLRLRDGQRLQCARPATRFEGRYCDGCFPLLCECDCGGCVDHDYASDKARATAGEMDVPLHAVLPAAAQAPPDVAAPHVSPMADAPLVTEEPAAQHSSLGGVAPQPTHIVVGEVDVSLHAALPAAAQTSPDVAAPQEGPVADAPLDTEENPQPHYT